MVTSITSCPTCRNKGFVTVITERIEGNEFIILTRCSRCFFAPKPTDFGWKIPELFEPPIPPAPPVPDWREAWIRSI